MMAYEYKCPRCGYKTKHKASMWQHFYRVKKTCSDRVAPIPLTESVMSAVMSRTWTSPPASVAPTLASSAPTTQYMQVINNHFTINNFMTRLDPAKLAKMCVDHAGLSGVPFEAQVDRYCADNLAGTEEREMPIKDRDILHIVDEVSRWTEEMDKVNILYDSKRDRYNILESAGWEEMIEARGVVRIFETIKNAFLNDHEMMLIRRMHAHATAFRGKAECREQLEHLYRCFASIDLEPYCMGSTDDEFVEDGDPCSEAISEKCMEVYHRVKSKLTTAVVQRFQRDIKKIVKSNSLSTVKGMLEYATRAFTSDAAFRNAVVPCGS